MRLTFAQTSNSKFSSFRFPQSLKHSSSTVFELSNSQLRRTSLKSLTGRSQSSQRHDLVRLAESLVVKKSDACCCMLMCHRVHKDAIADRQGIRQGALSGPSSQPSHLTSLTSWKSLLPRERPAPRRPPPPPPPRPNSLRKPLEI